MNRKYIFTGIIAALLGVGYIFYANFLSPADLPPSPAVEVETAIPANTDERDETIRYTNKDFGFEFAYQSKYGTINPRYYPSPDTPLEDLIISFPGLHGVTVQNRGYDSGTGTPKEPVCPDKTKCERNVNLVGSDYFETTITYMGGELIRKEFPISSVSSLVIEYDISLEASIIAELEELADTVTMK